MNVGLKCFVGAAAVLALGVPLASATTLGTIEYDRFTNTSSPYTADLGGVSGAHADATVGWNDFNGASTLPGGIPMGYDVQIDRTFIGDSNTSTADSIDDRFLFKLDPTTGTHASADATLTIVTGVNTGMDNVMFELFEADASGNAVGAALASNAGGGNFVAHVDSSTSYLLSVMGNLRADIAATLGLDESTNVGRYDIVLALVPLPPAILLFLTALGALFGGVGLRKRMSAA